MAARRSSSLGLQEGGPAGQAVRSTAGYFEMLLRRAETAAHAGNYGIAAALVVRSDGREVISLANNTVFADHDPAGHAEMNAIRQAHAVMLGHAMAETPAGEIVRQQAPSRATEMILFATLEPCPMCTICAINAGVSQVVIATPDPLAGAMAPERLSKLAPLWGDLVSSGGPRITFCQSDDPHDELTYLPRSIVERLERVFGDTRSQLDASLARVGVLDPELIVAGGRAAEAK